MAKHCVFCGTSLKGNKSPEHVFPQWLLRELNLADVLVSPTHWRIDRTVASVRLHTLGNLVTGGVCSRCNNGWMSRLETAAQPILLPLMTDERSRLDDLSAENRFVLARWAAKTYYMLSLSANFNLRIRPQHLRELRKYGTRLPWRVTILAHLHDNSEPFYWLQHSSWAYIYEGDGKPTNAFTEKLRRDSYKVVVQIGRLLLMTMYCPLVEGWEYALWRGVHFPLWPQRGPVSWYEDPCTDFPRNDSVKAVVQFSLSACLASAQARLSPETALAEETINIVNR